jgi:hypothetical protein
MSLSRWDRGHVARSVKILDPICVGVSAANG